MNPRDILADLDKHGIRVWADGDQLRFRAPQGALSDDRRALLRENKQAVLEFLRAQDAEAVLTPEPGARHEPFPLTDIQAAYLLGRGSAYAYGGVACHAYMEVGFPANTDPDRLIAAWHEVVRRHDMLRAVVHPDGYQQVLADPPPHVIDVADLREADPEQVAERLLAVRAALSARVVPTDRWPLHDLRITRTGDALVLHLAVDLLVVDYASLQLVLAEVEDIYDGGTPAPVELTFRDLVLARRRQRQSTAYDRDREYWLRRVETMAPAPELPVVGDPAAAGGFRRLETAVPAATWSRVTANAAGRGVSASAAVLAAYAEVIGRWSRSPRFTLNVPTFDRPPVHPDVHRVVGDFTAVELLTVDLHEELSLADQARRIGGALLEDLSHPLFTGSEVLAELTRRSDADAVLMPVIFTSTLGSAAARQPAATVRYAVSQTPQVWLDCQVMERGGDLALSWDVRDGVLRGDVPGEMFAAFAGLVVQLADDAVWDAPAVVDLPARTQQVRAAVNDTAAPLPTGLLTDRVLESAARTPQAIAVRGVDALLTYRELVDRSAVVARALREGGVRPGELVAVTMDKGWEQVVGVLGTLLAGAAYLPVDLTQPALRRAAVLRDAGVRTVLTQSWVDAEAQWPEEVRRVPVDTLPALGAPVEPLTTDPDLAYVIYTSGSTGEPKGVMISHRAALNTIADINERFAVGPADRVLALAQLGFDLSVYDIFGPLSVGGAVVLPDPARRGDPTGWAETVAAHEVTVWNSVPSQMQMLADYLGVADLDLPSLRLAMLSGDWIPLSLPGQVATVLPRTELHSLGGATEASIWSIHHRIGEPDPAWPSIPYGKPLTNQSFFVLDRAMRPCPDHVAGELYIGGAGIAEGYLGDPERTAQRFITHPVSGRRLYRTGDLGLYHSDGVIEFLGRQDDQVKIRGYRIELGEIQAVLDAAPAVGASAVLVDGASGANVDAAARRLVAFVEPGRRSTPAPVPEPVLRAGTGALEAAAADVDAAALAGFRTAFDHAALLSSAAALAGTSGTADEICTALGVHDRHRRLVRRWLRGLLEAGLLSHTDGRYHDLQAPAPGDVAAAWDRAGELEGAVGWSRELFDSVRLASGQLTQLLRGETTMDSVLTADIMEAAYRGNTAGRALHRALVETVRALSTQHPGQLRVLEVGARAGGAAANLLPALAGEVDYLCTDRSPLLVAAAQRSLGEWPGVRFATFDPDADPRRQGFSPHSADVLICANVLNNSPDIDATLARLRDLVAPGGWLMLMENTDDDAHSVRISTEFLAEHSGPFTDARAEHEQSFLRPEQWVDALGGGGDEVVAALPTAGTPLAAAGQRLFVVRVKPDRWTVDVAALSQWAAERLPEYMVPSQWQSVDALPLTGNGKLDRAALISWLAPATAVAEPEQPADDLEVRLAELWQELLGVDRVGRHDDLFALGGDSLLVARMVGRLRDGLAGLPGEWDLEWEVVLRHLLRTPTIAGLAAYLRAAGSTGAGNVQAMASPVVRLSDELSGPVTVLVHAGTGTLLPYRPLVTEIRRAGWQGGLVGLEIPAPDDFLNADPDGLIDELAAGYAGALLETGARDFNVVGYCVGGVTATEMARVLTESGATVRSLTVISSHSPTFRIDDELLSEYSFALMMGMDLAKIGFPADQERAGAAAGAVLAATPGVIADGSFADLDGEYADIAATFRELETVPRMTRVRRMCDALPPELAGSYEPEGLLRTLRIYQQSIFALSRHKATPYAGDITFLRHNGAYPFPGSADTVTDHWAKLCLGELATRDIPGHHFTCMTGSNVQTVHGHLSELLGAEARA